MIKIITINNEIFQSYDEIIYCLKNNKKICKLSLRYNKIEVKVDLIQAALANKRLIWLDQVGYFSENETLEKLNKSCLKKIKMDKNYKIMFY